jgi:hypothetical protein
VTRISGDVGSHREPRSDAINADALPTDTTYRLKIGNDGVLLREIPLSSFLLLIPGANQGVVR